MPRFVPSFLKNAAVTTDNTECVNEVSRFSNITTNTNTNTNINTNSGISRFSRQNTYPPMPTNTSNINEQESQFTKSNNRFCLFKEEPESSKDDLRGTPVIKGDHIAYKPIASKPMTMAELTSSDGFTTVGSKKKTFGDKFKKPNEASGWGGKSSIPIAVIPKTDSIEDFPTLGGSRSTPSRVPTATSALSDMSSSSTLKQSTSAASFASLAKGWAKKTEDEKEAAELEKQRIELEKQEKVKQRDNMIIINRFIAKKDEPVFDDLEEPDYDNGFSEEEEDDMPSDDDYIEPSDEDEYDEYGQPYGQQYEQNVKDYEERY
jgi:hypothetical protein